MEYIHYLWEVGPFSLSAIVAVILALSSAARAHERSLRWFLIGAAGNALWAVGFAGSAAIRAFPEMLAREAIRNYVNLDFLLGSLLLCVFSLIYLSRNIVIHPLGKTTEKKKDGTGDQDTNTNDHDQNKEISDHI